MTTPHRTRFGFALLTWLLGTVLLLAAIGAFSYGVFVLLSVLGVIVITDVLAVSHVRPRWYGRLRRVATVGLVVAAAVIGLRLIRLFAPGSIP